MTAARFILSDCKSGRWIRCASDGQARRAALNLGWTDYEITEETRRDECALDPFGQAAIERRRHDEARAAEAEFHAREVQTHAYLRRTTDPTAAGHRMGLDELHHHRGGLIMDDQEYLHALLREARTLWRVTLWLAAVTLTVLLGLVVYAEFFMGRS